LRCSNGEMDRDGEWGEGNELMARTFDGVRFLSARIA
jgi:hypothetical protein